jgi:hypothetical protein
VNLRAEHPEADRVLRILGVIAVDLKVGAGAAPALIAEIDCPNGRVLLSSTPTRAIFEDGELQLTSQSCLTSQAANDLLA